MLYLPAILIDGLSTAIMLVPVLFILFWAYFRHMSKMKAAFLILFVLYLSALFSVVGIPSIYRITPNFKANYIPFLDISNGAAGYIRNMVLNIILFIPVGFLAPILWEEFRSLKKVTALGLGISLFIEIMQLFTFRTTDIDDLIANTLGTLVGFFIAKAAIKSLIFISGISDQNRAVANPNVYLLLLVVFLAMFIVQPLILNLIWLAAT